MAKCDRVLVWLGKATDASDQAFQYLRDISEMFAQMIAQNPWAVVVMASSTGSDLNIPPGVIKPLQDRRKTFQDR